MKNLSDGSLRKILANKIKQHDPDAKGPITFLRSKEPLNDFYIGVLAAMRHAVETAIKH